MSVPFNVSQGGGGGGGGGVCVGGAFDRELILSWRSTNRIDIETNR